MHTHHTLHHGRRGRGGGHGRGGGGRHRARRGAVRTAILTLLDERPMHGYEIITQLEERSGGRWRPSPGSIYPALVKMEHHGLVTSEEADGKRQFELTDRGRQMLTDLRAADDTDGDTATPWSDQGGDQLARGGDLRRHVSELVSQVRQIGRFGTPEQIEAAGDVLADAKKRLYSVLADDTKS